MPNQQKIRVKLTGRDADTAYVSLPGHPDELTPGVVAKTVCLDDVVENFKGPRVQLDFNNDGVLIGIEILVFREDCHSRA